MPVVLRWRPEPPGPAGSVRHGPRCDGPLGQRCVVPVEAHLAEVLAHVVSTAATPGARAIADHRVPHDPPSEPVGFDDIFSQSDFVSVNCPLTEETTAMIGDREYRMMKPSAYFITTARGGIHDEAALAEVLSEDLIAGAGLDVFLPEPPPADHPLMAFDNVIISPHIAGITAECTYNMASWAAQQWVTIFKGQRPPRLINPEAWPAYRDRFERITGAPVDE